MTKDIFESHIIFKLISLKKNNHLIKIYTNKNGIYVIKKIL